MRIHLAVLISLVVFPHCKSENSSKGTAAAPSQVAVNLPPSPSFEKEHPPETYSDGTSSIYGLRKNLKTAIDTKVRVRAFLLEVYYCPKCTGKNCKPCDQPHFWLTDRLDSADAESKDKALMVAEFDEKQLKRTKLMPGTQYTVAGTFTKSSPAGFAASDGLIIFESVARPDTAVAEN